MAPLTSSLPDDRHFEAIYEEYFDLLVQVSVH